ncbi:MAG: adenosylcobinamide-GDP ribazoletransferase [Lachnospiraceae bacterium]|nr:adenosylcobinamide-GDP ribazoletransferase [Lachnospiraceae bacterium]
MNIFGAVVTAFSTYSSIPMPQIKWDEKNMRYSMCAFPLIGVFIGALSWLFCILNENCIQSPFLKAVMLVLIPVWITGGIHLDGFMDTVDAICSRKVTDEKYTILKDPHIGAFAAIHLAALILFELGIFSLAGNMKPVMFILIYAFSRCLSGIAVVTFPVCRKSSLLFAFSDSADKKPVRIILAVMGVILAVMMSFTGISGVITVISGLLMFAWYRVRSMKEFEGINGDMAGWFVCLAEAVMFAAAILTETVILHLG